MIESECLYYGSATSILHSLIIIKKLKNFFSIFYINNQVFVKLRIITKSFHLIIVFITSLLLILKLNENLI